MKINKLSIILMVIILLLGSYIIYIKFISKEDENNNQEEVTLKEQINLDYLSIYLTSDGYSYLVPINKNEIDELKLNKNLKERLNTLYERGFYYDVYLDNKQLKGFRIKLDDDIRDIKKLLINDNVYIAFLKENNTFGLLSYDEYYNLLYTSVTDNFQDLKNVKDIDNSTIIFMDNSTDELKLKK